MLSLINEEKDIKNFDVFSEKIFKILALFLRLLFAR